MVYLAVFDFIPNFAFLVGAYFLVKIIYLVRGKACSGLATAGASLIAIGGFLQAIWKLLYASGTADWRILSNMQFILMAGGFAALLLAVILIARRSIQKTPPPMLAMASWKLPFLIIMVVTSLLAYGLLIFISIRRRVFPAGAGFIIAFISLLAMGGMAGAEQTTAQQCTEEITNAVGQGGFAIGSYLLYRDFNKHSC